MKILKTMNCIVCSKKKEDFEMYSKTIIAAICDSELENHDSIRKITEKSVICHDCMQSMISKVHQNRK
jgi:hypothetical protein